MTTNTPRQAGRPRSGPEPLLSKLGTALSKTEAQQARKAAAKNNQTLSAWIRECVLAALRSVRQ